MQVLTSKTSNEITVTMRPLCVLINRYFFILFRKKNGIFAAGLINNLLKIDDESLVLLVYLALCRDLQFWTNSTEHPHTHTHSCFVLWVTWCTVYFVMLGFAPLTAYFAHCHYCNHVLDGNRNKCLLSLHSCLMFSSCCFLCLQCTVTFRIKSVFVLLYFHFRCTLFSCNTNTKLIALF